MADRALTEEERGDLWLFRGYLPVDKRDALRRLLSEHAALREVALAAKRVADAKGRVELYHAERGLDAALAALEAAHPGVLGREG